jgi:hypothetical protein
MDQSASVAGKIATSNEVVVFSGTDGEWLDWKTFTSSYFIPYRGIRKYRHFVFQVKYVKRTLCFGNCKVKGLHYPPPKTKKQKQKPKNPQAYKPKQTNEQTKNKTIPTSKKKKQNQNQR